MLTYLGIHQQSKKKEVILKESKKEYIVGFGEREGKGRERRNDVIIFSK